MKKSFLFCFLVMACALVRAQSYPVPEFSNEVYWLRKDTGMSLVRLEKNSSKMDSKTKMGGMGGSESGYNIEGERSPVRLQGGNQSFIFSNGSSSPSAASNAKMDSMMRANGVDPDMRQQMSGMNDPSNTITLYKAETGKGKRKILMMKTPGMGFGSKKIKSSDKITFSVRKIKEGYWELVIDKPLSKGEYAFTIVGMGMSSIDGATTLYSFGID